jgi:tetratricopeptide (TPR) repeat protein
VRCRWRTDRPGEGRPGSSPVRPAALGSSTVQERKARRLTLSLAGTVLASVLLGGGGWLFLSKQRTARSENLRAEVAAALNDATRLRGQQEWAEALAAAQRAEHLVQSEGFEGLREQVGTELQGIRSDMEASQQAAQRKEDNASLLSALADIRQPTANLQTGPGAPNVDSKELNAEFSATLAKFDLDPDQGTEEEAARTILDRDLGPELAGILDEWSLLRKGMGDVPGSRRLNRVSDLCDTDESRRKLRPAIFTSRLAELEALARSPESASWSALTLNLLGTTLAQLGNHRTAAEVLQRAAAEAPRDFSVRLNLARTCIKLMQANDFASGFKALRHYEAALLLRPSSAEVHLELGVMLVAMRDQKSGIELLQRANELRGGQDQRSLALLAVALANDAQLDAALETGRKVDVAHLQSPEVVDLLNAINPHYRRKFLKGVGLEDAAPTPNIPNVTTQARRPDNMKPQPHETIGLKASLRSSTFDHESSRHAVTRWQIRGAEESYATNPTLDIMSSAFLTELPLLRGMLQPSKEYYWRVSHADEFNIATEFSEETAFRTADFKLHASPVDLEEHFNRDVIANPGDRTGDFFDQSGCRLVAENFPDASSGLPAGRQIGPHLLENYSVNNCIQITPKANSTVRIKAPRGHHDTLSFLVASGDGNVQLPVRVEYADGSFELLTLWIPDWYQDTGDKTFPEHVTARWNGMNRFCLGAVEQVQDAALFEIHMNLKPDVQLKSIDLHATAATFTDPSARAHVFAITALKAED